MMTWKPYRTLLATTAALSLFVGCGGDDEAAAPASTPEPVAEATPEETPEATPEATPEEAVEGNLSTQLTEFLASVTPEDKAKTNPKAGDAAAIEAGKGEFMSVCFACHGKEGKGDGPASGALNPKPGDLTDAAINARLTDGDRFAIMKNGIPGTAMQAFGAALSDDQIWSLLAYVSTLSASADAPTGDEPKTE